MLGLPVRRVVRVRVALLDALEIVLVLFLRLVIRPELLGVWQRSRELVDQRRIFGVLFPG